MQMEVANDINNIEKYVQKELANERNYRERLENANKRMTSNATHLVNSMKSDARNRAGSIEDGRVRLNGVMDGIGNNPGIAYNK